MAAEPLPASTEVLHWPIINEDLSVKENAIIATEWYAQEKQDFLAAHASVLAFTIWCFFCFTYKVNAYNAEVFQYLLLLFFFFGSRN